MTETKDACDYSLQAVKRLAGFQQVSYASARRIHRHLDLMGMRLADVCTCLESLGERHFHRSERYENDSRWHDVYLLPHPVPADPDERLYIKFCVDRDCVWIRLCSFHPEGWI